MSKSTKLALVSVMFCFFAMGFVDLVGIASNYVKEELHLNNATANIFPSLVFFWFLIFSVPTGMLMNRIGRKNTVLLSLLITVVSLLLPVFAENFTIMLVSFSLLGIGNALMQTSLNPLVATVTGNRNFAATLTFGQFIKAIASFLAPYIAICGASLLIPTFGLGWRILFPIYMTIGIAASALLLATPITEEAPANQASTYGQCLRLLRIPIVLLSFLGIMCHVGIDVGTNTTAPKIMMEQLGISLNEAAGATSLYFLFRTIGCLTGAWFLRILRHQTFFLISVGMMVLAMLALSVGTTPWILYTAVALVGYGNSNIFSIIFSQALRSVPEKQNEVSGLMIMGLFGGTLFPLLMGFAGDAVGQVGAVCVMAVGVLYLLIYARKITEETR